MPVIKLMVEKGASDLHIGVPSPPILRILGDIVVQKNLPPITKKDVDEVLNQIATPEQLKYFRQEMELDFAYSIPGVGRFRVNVMLQRGTPSIAFRFVPHEVPTIDDMELPQVLKTLSLKQRGLILVTGQTGTGKSTTLAAMVNHINQNISRTIITIEEPVEFLHPNNRSVIYQREVGNDTQSFARALLHALRHDPDVLVVGEMRDVETIGTAITAAETGHLVLGTLHTYSAPQSIDRIVDIFPSDQQTQIRFQLSQVIEAIITQTLVHRIKGGRIAACEIMIANPAIRNLIREGKIYQISNAMQLAAKEGMQTLDQSLAFQVKRRIVSRNEAFIKANDTEAFEGWIKES
jgi:twitching motility protein PilT